MRKANSKPAVVDDKTLVTVRRATHLDLRAILRIEERSFAHDAWQREQFQDYLEGSDSSVFVVAIINARIAGYAVAFHDEARAEIDSIAVIPRHRGRGVAFALMRRLMMLLRRRGIRDISLNVRIENKAAIQLYRKLGFRRVRRVNGYYEDGAPAWRMRVEG